MVNAIFTEKQKIKQSFSYTLEFEIGELVYLKTDIEQIQRIITGINIKPLGAVLYNLACGTDETNHYGIEITRDRDIIMATSN